MIKYFKKDFFILSIKWNSCFTYDNVYMDTRDLLYYDQHEHKREQRTKVRTRRYVDSDLYFFEFKQTQWDLQRKFRYQIKDPADHWALTQESKQFINGIYQSFYGEPPSYELLPTVKTSYKRITLCSKRNDERVTIDFDISLTDLTNLDSKPIELTDVVIVESKSTSTSCPSHQIMNTFWIAKASWCSKYCLWLYYHKRVSSRWSFKKTIDRIDQITRDYFSEQRKDIHHLAKVIAPELKKMKKTVQKANIHGLKLNKLKTTNLNSK